MFVCPIGVRSSSASVALDNLIWSERATGRSRAGEPDVTATGRAVNNDGDGAHGERTRARSYIRTTYRPSARKFKELVILILVLRCLRKIIVPIICWVASETLNRQCSTSESLSNLEASFGLISRFESIAHRYNYFFYLVCVCPFVSCLLSCVCCMYVCVRVRVCSNSFRLSYFFCFSFVFNYYLQCTRLSLYITLRFV